MCSVLRQAGVATADAIALFAGADVTPLTSPYEEALLRTIADFPAEVAAASDDLAPHQITFYLKDLAQQFHSYYNAERFLVDDAAVRSARLALVVATGQVLRNGLALLGISAPEQM
jgi:arginyl-tRNA synthetase